MQPSLTIQALCLMVALGFVSTASHSKLYRWVDDEGNIHYSDRVPPDQVEQERAVLDGQGIEREKVDQAKTREEQMLEQQRKQALAKLREEQQKLIQEQQAKDRILLRTFNSEDDIILARDNRLGALDVSIQVERSNIKRTKARLSDLQKSAADQERRGKKPSKRLMEDIDQARRKLAAHYGTMIQKEREKEGIFASYGKDMDRFRELKDISQPASETEQDRKRFASLLNNVFSCASAETCAPLWSKATDFVQRHATTRLQMLSETIVMSAPARKPEDISITISRINNNSEDGGFLIFVDMQCSNTPTGEDLCASETMTSKKREFAELMAQTPAT